MNKPSVLVARILVLLCCVFALPAWPSTVTVTSNADSGANTLRAALANANAGDSIALALPANSTITLASTLTVAKNVTIDGSGTSELTISGNHAVRAFGVNAGVTATIANLTIANGSNGVDNHGTLTVTGCTLAGNSSTGGNGGGVSNEGTLTLTDSTLSGNSSGFLGGGVYLDPNTVSTITNNTFVNNSANYGGGIFFANFVSSATVANNLFLGNTGVLGGGSAYDAGHQAIADHNLYWNNSDPSGAQGTNCDNCASNTNAVNADPLLGSLQNNGGPTHTYLPGAGSPAIAAGASAVCPATDQRGILRPQHTVGVCDIGSVQAVCYVNAGASGANNGSSWTDAFTDLQSALTNVKCTQIWVAKGTYKPATTDRTISFAIRRGVFLYGGFAGTESQVDPRSASNATILSGDIGTVGVATDNSYHVVRLDGTTAAGTITPVTNLIDGFTITGGNGNFPPPGPNSRGAGLYCDGSGVGHDCSPTLTNLDVVGNSVVEWAGGAFFEGDSGRSSPVLTDSTFSGNSAQYGGGLMCFGQNSGDCDATIANVTFSGNSATADGGGLYNAAYGTGAVGTGTSNPTLINVTFTANTASGKGGAMLSDGRNGGNSHPTLINVILWGDSAPLDAEASADNDAVGGNALATINTSVVQGGCPTDATCATLHTTDPLLGSLSNNGGLTPTIVPGLGGSAINSGDASACAVTPVDDLDQRGVTRPVGACDIGAVENDRIFANGFEGP